MFLRKMLYEIFITVNSKAKLNPGDAPIKDGHKNGMFYFAMKGYFYFQITQRKVSPLRAGWNTRTRPIKVRHSSLTRTASCRAHQSRLAEHRAFTSLKKEHFYFQITQRKVSPLRAGWNTRTRPIKVRHSSLTRTTSAGRTN